MENAADALKIAFAVFIFIVAITVAFTMISKAKTTGDYVLFYNDKTNFYENIDSKEKNRIVSRAEVISTLYRYYKESLSVTVDLSAWTGMSPAKRTFDLANSKYADINEIENDLKNYISYSLSGLYGEAKFIEEFVEIPTSGIYQSAEDGSEIAITSGDKKMYVTYTLVLN